jgi:hypothetical protein
VKFFIGLLAALAVLYFPGAVAALIGAVGALAVAASAQPACWAFLAGILAATRHRNPTARTAPKAAQA